MTELAASYEYSVAVARARAQNFYYSFLVLPEQKRLATQLADPSTYQAQSGADSGAGALKAMNERVTKIEEELLGCLERWETLESRKA